MKININNKLYDLTGFNHPGGSVIKTYEWTNDTRIDATNVFLALHTRSNKALTMLSKFPYTLIIEKSNLLETDFRNLNNRLINDGFYKPNYLHISERIVSNFAIWVIAGLFLYNKFTIISVILMSVNYVQCGWIQHECGHKSFTGNIKIDTLLQMVYLNILMGGNYRFWNDQHFSHHANTQNITHDKDLKTHPLVAFDKKLFINKKHNFLTKYQHLLYWPVINPIVWFIWSFISHPTFAYKKKHLIEYTSLKIVSLSLYRWYFGLFGFNRIESIIMFHIISLLGTMILLATFTVSHTTTGAYTENNGWVIPSANHTINIYDHWLTNWWMGYLNFQIEHHLFPTMPQFRQNYVGKYYVKPFFKKHNLYYNEKTFIEANKDVYKNLKTISQYNK
jgi:fatty acid desaturase|tara:strand:+ start:3339 stop:4514 length:1176 start_codon:yes stop_codon:yes gene_type:complete